MQWVEEEEEIYGSITDSTSPSFPFHSLSLNAVAHVPPIHVPISRKKNEDVDDGVGWEGRGYSHIMMTVGRSSE